MAEVRFPGLYIVWRDGRPRFVPGARERARGFQGRDLRHGDGRWFSLADTEAWGKKNLHAMQAARGGEAKPSAAATPAPRGRTVEALLDDFLHAMERGRPGPKGRTLSAKSIAGYRKAAAAVTFTPMTREQAARRREKARAAALLGLDPPPREREPFSLTAIENVDKVELNQFYLYAKETRGHHMAVAMVGCFSAAYSWAGTDARWRLGANPRHALKIDRPQGRIVVIALPEFFALVEAADALGRASVGDSFYLGLFTGQRQNDRLLLADEGASDGRRHFRQSKTGKLVRVKEASQLAARLDAARKRVAAIKLRLGTRPATVVVDETTGLPYNDTTYRHWVSQVRARAALKLPSIAGKRDQDLRDTFVTMTYRAMVRAGNVNLKAIADVTGHSYSSIETIMKHYLGGDVTAADLAIDTLADFVQREGTIG